MNESYGHVAILYSIVRYTTRL